MKRTNGNPFGKAKRKRAVKSPPPDPQPERPKMEFSASELGRIKARTAELTEELGADPNADYQYLARLEVVASRSGEPIRLDFKTRHTKTPEENWTIAQTWLERAAEETRPSRCELCVWQALTFAMCGATPKGWMDETLNDLERVRAINLPVLQ